MRPEEQETSQADEIARAGARAWECLMEAVPGGRVWHSGGALAVVTGLDLSGYNGVWGVSASVEPDAIAALLDEVATAGFPFCMQLRPKWPAEIDVLAKTHGLVRVPGEPVMVLEDAGRLGTAQHLEDLSIRQLAPDEGRLHGEVVARCFDEPEEPHRQLMSPEVMRSQGMRAYVGEHNGEVASTCVGVTVGECVAIFGVATLPSYRRRGYAAAVTARAVGDGFAAGASWAWLSASEQGFGVYAGLGFETVERWDFWEAPTRQEG